MFVSLNPCRARSHDLAPHPRNSYPRPTFHPFTQQSPNWGSSPFLTPSQNTHTINTEATQPLISMSHSRSFTAAPLFPVQLCGQGACPGVVGRASAGREHKAKVPASCSTYWTFPGQKSRPGTSEVVGILTFFKHLLEVSHSSICTYLCSSRWVNCF